MPDKIEDESILTPDFSRQEIREGLLQATETRILVVEFDDFFKPELSQRLGNRFTLLNRPRKFWRNQIILNPDDYRPRLVIKDLGHAHLCRGRSKIPGEEETKEDGNEPALLSSG